LFPLITTEFTVGAVIIRGLLMASVHIVPHIDIGVIQKVIVFHASPVITVYPVDVSPIISLPSLYHL
jgi:hypothetical protein